MRKTRTCTGSNLNTGVSKCHLDPEKVKGAILVPHGVKLPAEFTASKAKELCHADRPERIYPILPFVEFAKNGGEPQVAANGYGPSQMTGISALTYTFTLDKFYPELNASLTKTANKAWDAYFYDEKNVIYGLNDGSDTLAGIPMSTVYSTPTPHPTSSAAATMDVSFAFEDARYYFENMDFVPLDFAIGRNLIGLTPVELVKVSTSGNDYKLLEKIGGYDLTSTYGPLFADNANLISGGASGVTYNENSETLTIATTGGAVPALKAPSALFEAGIEGIEQV